MLEDSLIEHLGVSLDRIGSAATLRRLRRMQREGRSVALAEGDVKSDPIYSQSATSSSEVVGTQYTRNYGFRDDQGIAHYGTLVLGASWGKDDPRKRQKANKVTL